MRGMRPEMKFSGEATTTRRDQPWDVSLDDEGDDSDAGADEDNQPSDGLRLDPASINALANALQKSMPTQQPHHHTRTGNRPPTSQEQDSARTSTPTDTPDADPRQDADETMESVNISTGSRKRTRGGRKHRKSGTVSTNSDEAGSKLPKRTSPPGPDHSQTHRGPGRPPGSCNKKYAKQRSSSRNGSSATKAPQPTPVYNHPTHQDQTNQARTCLLYTSPSPRDRQKSRMPSSA